MSIHQTMIDRAREEIEAHPAAWSKIFRTVRERLRSEPSFAQDLRAFSMTPEHVTDHQIEWYYALQCYTKVLMGDIGACKIVIGATPVEDKRMEVNDQILRSVLQKPFYASAGRDYEDDGSFGWDAPIRATRFVKGRRGFSSVTIELEPWCAPLEIGYTHGYRSYLHLWRESALARWCYDDTFVQVFQMLPHAAEAIRDGVAAMVVPGAFTPEAAQMSAEQLMLWN